jgi:hypothetical protein
MAWLGNKSFEIHRFTIFLGRRQHLLFVVLSHVTHVHPARIRDAGGVELQNQLAELKVVPNPSGKVSVGYAGDLNICCLPSGVIRVATSPDLLVDIGMPVGTIHFNAHYRSDLGRAGRPSQPAVSWQQSLLIRGCSLSHDAKRSHSWSSQQG